MLRHCNTILISAKSVRRASSSSISKSTYVSRIKDNIRLFSTEELANTGLCGEGSKFDASILAKPIRNDVRLFTSNLLHRGKDLPKLVALLANDNPSSLIYCNLLNKCCAEDGIQLEVVRVEENEIEEAVHVANIDPTIHAMIVCYPIFDTQETASLSKFCRLTGEYLSRDDYLRDNVIPQKDAEGLGHVYNRPHIDAAHVMHPKNASDLTKEIVPCNAEAIMKCLSAVPGAYNEFLPHTKRMDGLTVTIINRSPLYGHPLAVMLNNEGAEVYSVALNSTYHFKDFKYNKVEQELESCIRNSNVIITGVPDKNFYIPGDWIQPQSIIVNMSEFDNIDEAVILEIPGAVLLSGVGSLSRAILQRNVVSLYEAFHSDDEDCNDRSDMFVKDTLQHDRVEKSDREQNSRFISQISKGMFNTSF